MCFPFLRMECLYKLLSILHGKFVYSPLIYLIQPFLYINIYTHGYLFYTLCYNLMLLYFFVDIFFCTSIRPLGGELLVGCCFPLINPISVELFCFLSEHFLLWASLVYFLPRSWNQPFLQGSLVSFLGKWY